MKKYALLNEDNVVVSVIVCVHDFKVPAGHSAHEIQINDDVLIGDKYDSAAAKFVR